MVGRCGPVHWSSLVGCGGVGSRSGDVGSRGRSIGSRGVGGLGSVGRIGRLTGVHNIGDVAAVSIAHLIVDSLKTTVGQGDGIRPGGGVAVPLLTRVNLHAVVVVHGVVVGVDGGLVVGGSRGGVAVAGCVVGESHSGDGGEKNDDLKRMKTIS
jgi:hypothetical protein